MNIIGFRRMPKMLCPECVADRSLDASRYCGKVGIWYRCPACRDEWSEACFDRLAEDSDTYGNAVDVECELPAGHDHDHKADRYTWNEHGWSEQLSPEDVNDLCVEVTGKTSDELIWEQELGAQS